MYDFSRRFPHSFFLSPSVSFLFITFLITYNLVGNYAYVTVARELRNSKIMFRLLALSATPGSDLKAIQEVLTNLAISNLEVRTDTDPDVRPYVHGRQSETIVVQLSPIVQSVYDQFARIYKGVLQRLYNMRLYWETDPTKVSWSRLNEARNQFRQNPPQELSNKVRHMWNDLFSLRFSISCAAFAFSTLKLTLLFPLLWYINHHGVT